MKSEYKYWHGRIREAIRTHRDLSEIVGFGSDEFRAAESALRNATYLTTPIGWLCNSEDLDPEVQINLLIRKQRREAIRRVCSV